MKRNIKIIEDFSGYKEETICYNTGSSLADQYGFDTEIMKGKALRNFYRRILLGETFPSEMILGRLDLEGAIASTLFANPRIILQDDCSSIINSIEMIMELGDIGQAHIPTSHSDLFSFVDELVNPEKNYTVNEKKQKALKRATSSINEYLMNGQLPPMKEEGAYEVIRSSGEFIAYQSNSPLFHQIYRDGFLCGMWINSEREIVLYKKSQLVEFDLNAIKREIEKVDENEWNIDEQNLTLSSPENISISRDVILDILI
jgi:hypothetical protein